MALNEQLERVPLVGTDLHLELGENLSVHQQHPRVAWPQCLFAWEQLFPGLILQGCCPEPLWNLPQFAWERHCSLIMVCSSPLQWGHVELGTMWL